MKPRYRIYPTLLDAFTQYEQAEAVYEQYYGWSENPSITLEEFCAQRRQELIDRINRVPFESAAADRGTVFNELVDCLIERRKPREGITAEPYDGVNGTMIRATYKEQEFCFPRCIIQSFADYYQGALTQQFVSSTLPTEYGEVELYGYIDELMPLSVHDIKTTGSYSVGKYKDHAQHLVYPYCLMQQGNKVYHFEYDILELDKKGAPNGIYKEVYLFNPERDIPLLRDKVEAFIRFLEENKTEITDIKVFGYEKPNPSSLIPNP